MSQRRILLCLLMAVGLSSSAIAQDVMVVTAATLNEHINHRAVPVYPPIAKAARVQGAVVLDIEVGTKGNVESMKVASGPPMLQQAAIDCLKQWTFHPFEKDSVPVAATGPISIEFTLDEKSGPRRVEIHPIRVFSTTMPVGSTGRQRFCVGCQPLPADRRSGGVAFPGKRLVSRQGDFQAECACHSGSSTLPKREWVADAQKYADKAVAMVSEGCNFDADCVWAFSGRAVD